MVATPSPTGTWSGACSTASAGARRDLVLVNAAAGLVVAGVADDLATGYEAAAAAVDDGAAAGVAERLVAVSQQEAAASVSA